MAELEQGGDELSGLGLKLIAGIAAHEAEDVQELGGGVVLEVNELVEAGGEAGVGLDELLHEVGVTGNDDDEGISVVLHGFEDGIHGFLTVVSLFVGVCEGVSLIDEEDAAHGFLDDLLSFDGCLTDKACFCPLRKMLKVRRFEGGACLLMVGAVSWSLALAAESCCSVRAGAVLQGKLSVLAA